MTTYLRVVNRDKFQHYKKRNPPWIKLYRTVITGEDGQLDDFLTLDEGEQWQLVRIWVLASQCEDGLLRNDEKWIRRAIRSERPVPLARFLNEGWLEEVASTVASTALAEPPEIGAALLANGAQKGADVAPQRSTREVPEDSTTRPGSNSNWGTATAAEMLLLAIRPSFKDDGTRTLVLKYANELDDAAFREVLRELRTGQRDGSIRNDGKWVNGALAKRARKVAVLRSEREEAVA